MFFSQVKVTLITLPIFWASVFCGCRQSFMTLCDTFQDFENYNDTENLNELIIGSETGNHQMVSVNFMETLKLDKYQLSSLIIIRSINNLEMTYHYECLYITSSLKYFSLYGNDLKRIERYHFPLMPLKKFSLVNNKIESIGEEAFKHQSMEILDLSDNFLETIERRALPETKVTKVLNIRNNKLTHIPPKSFPVSLESLNLDRNNLRYLQGSVFEDLVNLQQLVLSHNKFHEIPEVRNLTKLKIFDISYNEIRTVETWTFKNMDNLKLIDLSHNKISSRYILNWLNVHQKQPSLTVSLALNRLKDLNLENLPLLNKTFILYGNPWNCSRWNVLKTRLKGHESKCDLEFLADEENPFCISYSPGVYNFSGMWEADIDRYHQTVKKNKKMSQCTFALKKYQLVYPVDFFCVFLND